MVGDTIPSSRQRARALRKEMLYSIKSPPLLTIVSPSPLDHQAMSATPFRPSMRAWQIHCAVEASRILTTPTFLLVPRSAIQRPQGERRKRSQERWSLFSDVLL